MTTKLTENRDELIQILEIQNDNHLANFSIEDQKSQGFLTVRHDIELLTKMNDRAKQIIAVEEGKVIGYALVMHKDLKKIIPALVPMFDSFEKIVYKKKKLSDYNYYVMGQVCIIESHRRKGIFKDLYLKHRECYSQKFEICLTEVSTSNIPSMKAHKKLGFEIVNTFKDETDEWNVLLWDWK